MKKKFKSQHPVNVFILYKSASGKTLALTFVVLYTKFLCVNIDTVVRRYINQYLAILDCLAYLYLETFIFYPAYSWLITYIPHFQGVNFTPYLLFSTELREEHYVSKKLDGFIRCNIIIFTEKWSLIVDWLIC